MQSENGKYTDVVENVNSEMKKMMDEKDKEIDKLQEIIESLQKQVFFFSFLWVFVRFNHFTKKQKKNK